MDDNGMAAGEMPSPFTFRLAFSNCHSGQSALGAANRNPSSGFKCAADVPSARSFIAADETSTGHNDESAGTG
jgi:hypothetical protein